MASGPERHHYPAIADAAADSQGLNLLVLHGSAARGDRHALSDWDFGYLADERFDPARLSGELALVLETDQIDLADLSRAGALLRYRTARDGVVMFEADDEAFARFWLDAVSFWCDMGPILEAQYRQVLSELPRQGSELQRQDSPS